LGGTDGIKIGLSRDRKKVDMSRVHEKAGSHKQTRGLIWYIVSGKVRTEKRGKGSSEESRVAREDRGSSRGKVKVVGGRVKEDSELRGEKRHWGGKGRK